MRDCRGGCYLWMVAVALLFWCCSDDDNDGKDAGARTEAGAPDSGRPDGPASDLARVDAPPGDSGKPDAPKPDAPKSDAPKPDLLKHDGPAGDTGMPDAPAADLLKSDVTVPDLSPPDAVQPDAPPASPGEWATALGGSAADEALAVEVDSKGDIVVTGYFQGTAMFGATQLISAGSRDIFVAKLDGATGKVKWAVKAGGKAQEYATALAVNSKDEIFITGQMDVLPAGSTGGSVFGGTTLVVKAFNDVFVAKLDSTGKFLWAVGAGGSQEERGEGIAVDASGNIWVTGYSTSSDAMFGTHALAAGKYPDIFVTKLDATGKFLWVQEFGGTSYDYGLAMAVDANGNGLVAGRFSGTAAKFGSFTLAVQGGYDLFVASLSPAGVPKWVVSGGGKKSGDYAVSLAADSKGDVHMAGSFQDSATFGGTTLKSLGTYGKDDALAAKISATGVYQWAKQAGGTDYDVAKGAALDSKGNMLIAGQIMKDVTIAGTTLKSASSFISRGFMARLTPAGVFNWAVHTGDSTDTYANDVAATPAGKAVMVGKVGGSVTLEGKKLTSSGGYDVLVWSATPK